MAQEVNGFKPPGARGSSEHGLPAASLALIEAGQNPAVVGIEGGKQDVIRANLERAHFIAQRARAGRTRSGDDREITLQGTFLEILCVPVARVLSWAEPE